MLMTINYKTGNNHGTMTLQMDSFFPCTMTRLRKTLKVIDMSENREEHRADLVIYLNERLADDPKDLDKKRRLANEAVNYKTKAEERTPQIEKLTKQVEAMEQYIKLHVYRNDRNNGYRKQLKQPKEQLKQEKDNQRLEMNRSKEAERTLEKMMRDEKNLRENLTFLEREEGRYR